MDYQIKCKPKDEDERVLASIIFHTFAEAQSYADGMNQLNPNAHFWPVEVMEGPFVKNGDDVVLNPKRSRL